MGFLENFSSASSHFLASFFDIGTDLINSLDFLGYNVSEMISDTVIDSLHSPESTHNVSSVKVSNPTNADKIAEKYEKHEIWGLLGIFIIFFPGIVAIPPVLFYQSNMGRYKMAIIFAVLLCCYPITLISISFGSLFRITIGKGSQILWFTRVMVGAEAFFESFPQMILQLFTIAYGYEITTAQKVSIFASFLLISRTAISYDLLMAQKEFSLSDTIIHTIKVLPGYVTTILFRVAAFTLTIAFLRGWSIIPIFILYLEILAVTYIRYRHVKDVGLFFMALWFVSISNLTVLNVYGFGESQFIESDRPSKESGRKFIRLSSVVTFVHHTLLLASIMVFVVYHPGYLLQEQFDKLILKPGGAHFFYAFGITLMLGFYSLVLCLYLSKKV